MTSHNFKMLQASKQLIESINTDNPLASRLIGSTAVAICCPNAIELWNSLKRKNVSDIDIVTTPSYLKHVYKSLFNLGYSFQDRANLVSTALYQRPLFDSPDKSFHVEILSSPLILHHRLILDWNNCPNPFTVNLTDLFLSKLQFEFKDTDNEDFQEQMQAQLIDLTVLLFEIPLNDGKPTTLFVKRITRLASSDWALFKTLFDNLIRLQKAIASDFARKSSVSLQQVTNKISVLIKALESEPKTCRWKTRFVLQKALPFLPIGNPVSSPLEDRWCSYVKY